MEIQKMFLTPNKYSRPQIELEEITGVVVHYVGNAGTSALANRNYFEGNKDRKVYSSSHYIIGLEGEIIQCVPEDEIAYCSNNRNIDTISIECCHPESNGKFTNKTLKSLKELLVYLIEKYNLNEDGLIRHFDITGKMCPLYFAKYQEKWEEFKESVFLEINKELLNALRVLEKEKIITNKEYWIEMTRKIKYLDILLINSSFAVSDHSLHTCHHEEVKEINEALQVLIEKGVITSTEYWENAVKDFKYLDVLLIKIADYIK